MLLGAIGCSELTFITDGRTKLFAGVSRAKKYLFFLMIICFKFQVVS